MKFLSKLFGKGSDEEAESLDETAVEATAEMVESEPTTMPEVATESETEMVLEAVAESEVANGSGDPLGALRALLGEQPGASEHHDAVRQAIPLIDGRIEFYQGLVGAHQNDAYHGLSLGRVFREAGRHGEAIPHYQRYLRSAMDAQAFEELAETYTMVGDNYLASSSAGIAASLRSKGV